MKIKKKEKRNKLPWLADMSEINQIQESKVFVNQISKDH